MIRFLILSLLSISALASTPAPLTYCWDGLPTTTLGTDCPPLVTQAGLQEATGANAARVRAVSDIQFDAAYLKHLPTVGGVCPAKPSYAEMVAAVSVPGAAAGAFSGVVTDLTAAGEYCTYAMAVRRDQPPANTTNPGLYIAVSEPWTFTPPVVGGVVKWNPGQYMLPTEAPNSQMQGATNQAGRFARYDELEIADPTGVIKGVALRTQWGQLERNNPGEYEFAWVHAELERLGQMDPPRRLWIRIQTGDANNSSSDACTTNANFSASFPRYFPRYARVNNMIAWWPRDKCQLAFWRSSATNAYIMFLQALGNEFDGHPLFEGITLQKETATRNISGAPADYNVSVYLSETRRMALAAKAAFPTSNVVLNINFLPGGTNAQLAELVTWSIANGIGVGGPDTAPNCVGGSPTCANGFSSPQTSTLGQHYDRVIAAGSVGAIPIAYSIEPTQHNGTFSDTQFFGPEVFSNFCNDYALGCTHLFRGQMRGTQAKNPDNTWTPTLRDWLVSNPVWVHTQCPQSHLNRGGCLTGGTP
jgi:hypothetical protein